MRYLIRYTKQMVAFLFMGSAALLLLSCNSKKGDSVNKETLVTLRSDSISMVVSKNGLKSYMFKADVMEQYALARDPYTLYPKGVFVENFNDSTGVVESTLRADEAVYYEKRDLWMVSGDVIASGSGRTLYTEQLFWDAKTNRVYSNVRSRIVDPDVQHIGEGFESDEKLSQYVFRDYEGAFALDTSPVSEEERQANESAAEASSESNANDTRGVEITPRGFSRNRGMKVYSSPGMRQREGNVAPGSNSRTDTENK